MGDQRSQDRGNIPHENHLACVAERISLGKPRPLTALADYTTVLSIIDADITSCHTSSRARDIRLLLVLSPSHVCTNFKAWGGAIVGACRTTKPLLKPLTRRGYI